MISLCSTCNICSFMPEQKTLRMSHLEEEGEKPVILVIDDEFKQSNYSDAVDVAMEILGEQKFTYTTTIRCNFTPGELTAQQVDTATQRCSVWTHHLLNDRLIILSTITGVKQMKLPKVVGEGDMFRSPLGYVLVIPALGDMKPEVVSIYKNKALRLLKESKLE